jgi:hypothetical protein
MNECCVCTLDNQDRITAINQAWLDLLAESGRPVPHATQLIGSEPWFFFENSTTHQLCRRLVGTVRTKGKPLVVSLRCDLPHVRRQAEKSLLPLADGGVEMRLRILKREPRVIPAWLDSQRKYAEGVVIMCSWCYRLKASIWLEVEAAERELNLLTAEFPPKISHGLCPDCEVGVNAQIDAL